MTDLTARMLAFHLFWVDFVQEKWDFLYYQVKSIQEKTPSHTFTNEKGPPPGDLFWP